MEIDDVFDELHDAAAQLGIVAPGFGTSKGKAYEVWIMLELVVGLMARGFDVHPLDCDDELEPYFRVSGSPADMPGAGSKNAPCHFMFVRNGRGIELHLGLNHRGISGSTHELDLTFVPAPGGYAIRQSGGGPWDGAPVVGLELKAYTDTHKLPHDIPRALLGVAVDLDPTWPVTAWTFHTFGGGERRLSPSFRASYSLLTATELHASSEQYLTYHGVLARGRVVPAGNVAAIDEVVDIIDTGFPSII